jgi:hypothetical protein
MKNSNKFLFIFTIAQFLIHTFCFAQAPQKMSYQAVIRDATNALVANQTVGMQVSILQGSASGTAVYVETQSAATNTNGLVSIEIGGGIVTVGNFNAIDWANGPFFIKTETDPNGGTAYTIAGTNELMSVPYALFSANGASGGTQYFEKELVSDGENNVAITFPLSAFSKVHYNGALLRLNQWSGVVLTTLTLNLDTRQHDKLTVKN